MHSAIVAAIDAGASPGGANSRDPMPGYGEPDRVEE
jgi:hypothetical protein